MQVRWTHANDKDVFRWVVYYSFGNSNLYKIMDRNDRSVLLPGSIPGKNETRIPVSNIAITAVDRMGNESEKRTPIK